MLKFIVVVFMGLWLINSVQAQRVPDSSVTGTARATIGIDPTKIIGLPDPGGGGLSTAYEPSWTVLIGNTAQSKIPRKVCLNSGECASIKSDGSVVFSDIIYSCSGQMVTGEYGYICDRGIISTSLISYGAVGPATGSKSVGLPGGVAHGNSASPQISSDGKLIGWTLSVFDGQYKSASFTNPALANFVSPSILGGSCTTTSGYHCYVIDDVYWGSMTGQIKATWSSN